MCATIMLPGGDYVHNVSLKLGSWGSAQLKKTH